MSAEPLVSVVLPTYNRSATVGRAIQSVLRQTCRDLELIVVDDCSPEDPEPAVTAAAAGDPRVRFVRREANGGAAAARNTGLALARGRYVAFQDSDDEWLSTKLERQVEALRQGGSKVSLCVSGYLVNAPDYVFKVYYLGARNLLFPRDLRRQTLENFYFPTPTWLAPREALQAAGDFDEKLRCWEDWELGIRLAHVGDIVLIDEPLHLKYETTGSVNKEERSWGAAMRRIIERHEPRWQHAPRTLAQHSYVVGRVECLYGSAAEGRIWLRKAVRLNPMHWRAWLALLVASLGDSAYRDLVGWSRRARNPAWLKSYLEARRARKARLIDAAGASEHHS
jgi:glycosyltransferase involved in cell wall biosynthesis